LNGVRWTGRSLSGIPGGKHGLYTQINDYVVAVSIAREWPDLQAIFARAAGDRRILLPLIACQAVGGSTDDAVSSGAAIACAYIGIILIDDLLDEDPRGAYHRIGAPAAANLGAAFQVAAAQAILHGTAAPQAKLAALHGLAHMLLSTALGQHWDAQNQLTDGLLVRAS
jgi:hypothetical protein